MNAKALLGAATHLPIGEDARLGAKLGQVFDLVNLSNQEGTQLLNRFYTAEARAMVTESKDNLAIFDQAAAKLLAWGRKTLGSDHLPAFRGEIEQRSKVLYYRSSSVGVSMPKLAKVISKTLPEKSLQYQGLIITRLWGMKGSAVAAEKSAFTAFQRIQAVVGNGTADGWSRVSDYCAKFAPEIAKDSKTLRDFNSQLAQLSPSTIEYKTLLGLSRQGASKYRWGIRGRLGEIYLHHWPQWRRELSSLLIDAEEAARWKMQGNGWKVHPFHGGVRINSKETWDEGILLLNRSTERVAVHTAAQVKVENEVSALIQTIEDRKREIGIHRTPPDVHVLEGEVWRKYVFEALPPGVSTNRYVFHARDGRIAPVDIAKLEAWQLRAKRIKLDISIDEFDELALQFMYAAEDFLAK